MSGQRGALDLFRPYRFFFGSDVFISYARADGNDYAKRLAQMIGVGDQPLSIAFDHWLTQPGATVPQRVLGAARNASALVVVASPAACKSKAVDAEIAAFMRKPGAITIVSFRDAPMDDAVWHYRLAGIAPAWEPRGIAALVDGDPDPAIIERLRGAVQFWEQARRIRTSLVVGLVTIALALAATVGAAMFARMQIDKADKASATATAADARAKAATAEAGKQTKLADAEKRRADAQLAIAQGATVAADAAKERERTANAQADAAQRRSDAIDLAGRARDMFSNEPMRAREALRIAVKSLETARTSSGEAVTRDILMQTPRLVQAIPLQRNEPYYIVSNTFVNQTAASRQGLLVRASLVDERRMEFDVELRDAFLPSVTPRTVRITGMVGEVQFPGRVGDVILRTDRLGVVGDTTEILWIAPGTSASVRLHASKQAKFAANPARREVAVSNEGSVEVWSLENPPKSLARHALKGVVSLAYAPDGASLFALTSDAAWALDGPGAHPRKLIEGEFKASQLVATAQHLVISGRSYRLAKKTWTHDDLVARRVVPIGGDRVLLVTDGEVQLRDLAHESVDYYVNAKSFKCPQYREQTTIVTNATPSADGSRLALACATGLALAIDLKTGRTVDTAPLGRFSPHAAWVSPTGEAIAAYGERSQISAEAAAAELTLWRSTNRCPSLPPTAGDPRANVAFSPDGSVIATLSRNEISIRDRMRGMELGQSTINGSFPGRETYQSILAIARGGSWVALSGSFGYGITMWRSADGAFVKTAVDGRVTGTAFGGAGDRIFAASAVGRGRAKLAIAEWADGQWQPHSFPAGFWYARAVPDNIAISPVAASGRGEVAYLAPAAADEDAEDPETFRRVAVWREGSPLRYVFAPSAVSALAFLSAGTLVLGTRDGRILVERADGLMQIGAHDQMISMLLPRPGSPEIFAVDRDDTLRLWNAVIPVDQVGTRGFMETPLNSYGISNYSEVGLRSLAVAEDTLLTFERFGNFDTQMMCWRLPSAANLLGDAKDRLGAASTRPSLPAAKK